MQYIIMQKGCPLQVFYSIRLLFNTGVKIILICLALTATARAQYIKKETGATLLGTAVKVSAAAYDDFQESFAIIRKGESFGIINKYGNFLVPYGKYKFNKPRAFEIDKDRCGFQNGMRAVRDRDSEAYGFIDINGNLIVPCTLTDVSAFMTDGFAWAKQTDAQGREEQVYIDKSGNKKPKPI